MLGVNYLNMEAKEHTSHFKCCTVGQRENKVKKNWCRGEAILGQFRRVEIDKLAIFELLQPSNGAPGDK